MGSRGRARRAGTGAERDTAEIDGIVAASLRDFAVDMFSRPWFGKEHDWVNAYAHGQLARRRSAGGAFYDVGQIGIEVAVGQPPGFTARAARRDLVLWPKPLMTCWDARWHAVNHPLMIMEWKVHRPAYSSPGLNRELDWLKAYSVWQPSVLAYAVEIDTRRASSVLRCRRVLAGHEDPTWLRCDDSVHQ